MHITPTDHYNNLFAINDIVSNDLVKQVLTTDWLALPFVQQQGQETWPRRLIQEETLPWIEQWRAEMVALWPMLIEQLGVELQPYFGTAFWIDEPGFICPIHTDGEMPGSLHLNWVGESQLGTTFYHSKNPKDKRFQTTFSPNSGYCMLNQLDQNQYRFLQWHGMLEPVPLNTYRLTSYTWLIPVK